MPETTPVCIVWLKRDLRLADHEPWRRAIASGLSVLPVYIWEPSLWVHPDYDERHARFIAESLAALNRELAGLTGERQAVLDFYAEAEETFEVLLKGYQVAAVYSHEEIGLRQTWDRDKAIAALLEAGGVEWRESAFSGVTRGLGTRATWRKEWIATMQRPLDTPEFAALRLAKVTPAVLSFGESRPRPTNWNMPAPDFQRGGITEANAYLESFLGERLNGYKANISSPNGARLHCSRLSPYLAWGNLSVRQVFRAQAHLRAEGGPKGELSAFASRLRWRDHFIQKFESEPGYEFENLNRAYDQVRNDLNPDFLHAFEHGLTGFPLIDACMRCARRTGYLNFRMRAMVTSFWTHTLWQPWRPGLHVLGRYWLDYEPGIHYTQMQMQAGTTGINTIRIYNPALNGLKHDAEATFVKTYVPELARLPPKLAHQPELATQIDLAGAGVVLGETYPRPIVDRVAAYRHANAELKKVKYSPEAKHFAEEIKRRLVNPE